MVHCQLFNTEEVTKGGIKTNKQKIDMQKNSKMLDVNSTVSVITLDVYGLNTNFKAKTGKRV